MKSICSSKKCTGCWACYNICPQQCIDMKVGHLQHLYPTINQFKCINCGLCKKICPVNNPLKKNIPNHTYAAWAKDKIEYQTSTSGGVASLLARYIINKKGIVYGCACLPDANFRHIRIYKEEDIEKLKGSKYVQSNINTIYRTVKDDLQKEKIVLFIGTPCQIAGLKSFLRKEYTNLYLVDLICHGVPSETFLKQHLIKKTGINQFEDIKFRKGNGDYVLDVTSNKKQIYYYNLWEKRYQDEYCNAFIDGFSLRPSCHTCSYTSKSRISDITIGDFWGIKDNIPQKHDYGISCILCNTNKGFSLVNKIKNELYIYERSLEEAVKGNSKLREPHPYNFRSLIFINIADYIGLSNAYHFCMFDYIHNLYKYPIIRIVLHLFNKISNRIIK